MKKITRNIICYLIFFSCWFPSLPWLNRLLYDIQVLLLIICLASENVTIYFYG